MTNEARMLLMHKDLQKYVGAAPVIGSAAASDSWLPAPDFCSDDERTRNVIDMQGHRDLYRRQTTKAGMNGLHSRLQVEVTVTTEKVPVTAVESSKIMWQAGMCKGMSDVQGYVGGYRQRVYVSVGMVNRQGRQASKGTRAHSWVETQGTRGLVPDGAESKGACPPGPRGSPCMGPELLKLG